MSAVEARVSFRRPVKLGGASVSGVAVPVDTVVLVANGTVVLEVAANLVELLDTAALRFPSAQVGAGPAAVPQERRPDEPGWVPEDLEQLARWHKEGRPVPELAGLFGRSPASVVAGLRALGVDVAGQEGAA